MDVYQALQLLDQLVSGISMNRNNHANAMGALRVLRNALNATRVDDQADGAK
jgi:hypothetical protein